MLKTAFDYIQEETNAYRQKILSLSKENIVLEAFRITIWDEIVDYFDDIHDTENIPDHELKAFCENNVVNDIHQYLLKSYEIPSSETISDAYTYVMASYTKEDE